MRHLIVCCDGTWQTTVNDSNVARLYRSLAATAADGTPQLSTYLPGVGTEGTLWSRLTGGLAGVGLSQNVQLAYRWLVDQHRPGDRIALFGFSRGAYTARSLAGMIGACGLLDPTGVAPAELPAQIERVYRRYRERDRDPDDRRWRDGLRFGYDPSAAPGIPVQLIGVWDTVGALGIPDHLGLLSLLDVRERFEFHDVRLNPRIPHARHAVALDELRGSFRPTLWQHPAPGQDVRQVWFPGDHLDVGGGHLATGLSDGALRWMIEEATAVAGLAFDPAVVAGFRPDPFGLLHPRVKPLAAIRDPIQQLAMPLAPRPVPRIDDAAPDVHETALRRQRGTAHTAEPYRPTHTPAVGAEQEVAVPATDALSATGLYLDPGEYRFAARGRWRSLALSAGPTGRNWLPPPAGGLVQTLVERGAAAYRRAVGDADAVIVGARREPDLPWLSLVGLVANEERDDRGQLVHPAQRLALGAGGSWRVERPGYLYAFANDAWGSYLANAGTIRLAVTRTG